MTTLGLKEFQYGRIEVRMKMPVGIGLWPTFWMIGSNFLSNGWPDSGSATIAENVSINGLNNGLGPFVFRSTLLGPGYYGGNGCGVTSNYPMAVASTTAFTLTA